MLVWFKLTWQKVTLSPISGMVDFIQRHSSLALSPLCSFTSHPSPNKAQVTAGARNVWMDSPPQTSVCTPPHTLTCIYADAFITCSFTNIWKSLSPDLVQTEETQIHKAVVLLREMVERVSALNKGTKHIFEASMVLCWILIVQLFLNMLLSIFLN